MVDRLLTKTIIPEGGMITNLSPVLQGQIAEGSLIEAQNFEPDNANGGYRRISGYTKFDSDAITGSGAVLGVFVFNSGVIGARGTAIYHSSGSGWTQISTAAMSGSATKYRGHRYRFTTEKIIIVNGFDYPVRWDGTTFDHMTNANFADIPTDVQGVSAVWSFKNHMFMAKGELVFFSIPGDETDYRTAGGGGIINVGFEVTAMRAFRGVLYLFGPTVIMKITGSDSTDFSVLPVSNELGIVAPDTLQEVGGDIVFLSRDGIRTLSSILTLDIDDINLFNISKQIDNEIKLLDFDSGNKELSTVVIREKDQYRLFAADSTEPSSSSRGLLGGLRRQSTGDINWEWFDLIGIQANCADSGFINDEEKIVHGDFSGFVHTQESGNDFDGTAINARIRFPYWSFDDLHIRKILHSLTTHFTEEGTINPTIGYTLDFLDIKRIQPSSFSNLQTTVSFALYDTAIWDTDVYGDDAQNIITEQKLIGTCKNVSFFVTSNDSLAPYSLQLISVQYGLGGRR